jgi:hypothetical protein
MLESQARLFENGPVIDCENESSRQEDRLVAECEEPPPNGGGSSRNPGGDLLSQGGTPKYHRRWWA